MTRRKTYENPSLKITSAFMSCILPGDQLNQSWISEDMFHGSGFKDRRSIGKCIVQTAPGISTDAAAATVAEPEPTLCGLEAPSQSAHGHSLSIISTMKGLFSTDKNQTSLPVCVSSCSKPAES